MAARLGCSAATVGKRRARFVELRLDGLSDESRPGRPTSITAEQVEAIVMATLEHAPANATHWVAREDGRAHRPVEIHDRADLAGVRAQAPRADGFKLSNGPCS